MSRSLQLCRETPHKCNDLLYALPDLKHRIREGIEQVIAIVQGNSATAEESAAASEELSAQAQILKKLVEEFELS